MKGREGPPKGNKTAFIRREMPKTPINQWGHVWLACVWRGIHRTLKEKKNGKQR